MYIALCGPPGAGKSTVQQILNEEFGVVPVDDGAILRDIAVHSFGLTREQVSTTEGKNSYVEVMDKEYQVRAVLGEIGRSLENIFGEAITANLTVKKYCTDTEKNYSFGSVRRHQPEYFNSIGGVVVEVTREGCKPNYDFDHYYGKIDVVIENNGTPDELRQQIRKRLGGILT